MKTKITLITWLFLSCVMLLNLPAKAQGQWPFPSPGAPIASGALAPAVDNGLLEDPDSQIWVKVNAVQNPNPHNKMHTDKSNVGAPSYVSAGATVEVNFNVNKRRNRFTLVSYQVDRTTGLRTLFDYQSNLYNNGTPVQGNSNQQYIKVPNNCDWEVYLIKGALESNTVPAGSLPASFMAAPLPNSILTGPVGNPYAYSTDYDDLNPANNILRTNNRILDYTYGTAAPNTVCDVCPQITNGNGILDIAPNDDDQIYFRLIEIIERPATSTKELIFSVINTTNTKDALYANYDYIGDVLFSNILPAHHPRNNTPYQFRYNYQAGPQIPGYTINNPPTGLSYGPKDAFIFDQRNNHNNLDFSTYQSELFMFEVTNAVYDALGAPNAPQPEICAELSSKHPEPHKTLHPVFCADIDFCAPPCPTPPIEDICFVETCDFRINLDNVAGIADPVTGSFIAYLPSFEIINLSGQNINAVTFSTDGTTAQSPQFDDEFDFLPPTPMNFLVNAVFGILTFSDPTPDWNTPLTTNWFSYQLDAASVAIINNGVISLQPGATVTVTINYGLNQTFEYDFQIAIDDPNAPLADCQIVPLPVELTKFTGKPTNEGIALTWNTASEKNNDHFDIERSVDGKKFEKIGIQKGFGTTSVAHEYKFLDKHPQQGINYYRLKQVDFDGTSAYSQIVKVSAEKGALSFGVKLIPNPCSNENCSVLLQGVDTSKELVVEMKDLTGRTVLRQVIPSDQQSFNLPKANIGKGVYILSAKNGQYFTHQKVIIQ